MTHPKAKTRQPQWLDEFLNAYHGWRRREASRIYDANVKGHLSPDIVILGARAHMREQPAATIRILLELEVPHKTALAAEKALLLGEAFARTSDYAAADDQLEAALRIARRLKSNDLISEVGLSYFRRFHFEARTQEARHCLDLIRRGRSTTAHLNTLIMECHALSREEKTSEEAICYLELLRSITPGAPEHLGHIAVGTNNLAVLGRELYFPEAMPEVERHLSVPWTEDFSINRFQATKALAWSKALQGDYFNAFRFLQRASETAPSKAWSVVAACDRSYLARCIGEAQWSRHELDAAERAAETVDWHKTNQMDEAFALLLMAELFAPIDPTKSAMHLARHREIGETLGNLPLSIGPDRRTRAFFAYATAVTELALGNQARALAELRSARNIFDHFHYDWRAARCLLVEYRITGDVELLRMAHERLRNYGHSWLADELRLLEQQPRTVTLPRQQQRVFEELCQGKSTAQIAATLGRSEWTISNHIKQIFKAYNVKSRAELLAEAGRRGLLN
jgi:DNA-binding CsgD family transcriptional regulator